ncbi:maestro heat-like repeat-containing protein family member 1 [Hemicordylus capensis]|uniref:maestro heat-like repeat-containing protein family member 1 n=1 Tax=Hemicordylus capensis TaxID=884348 RepID=UPI002303CC96|nr:maestro heat-like repeat-containing protein family member 1 [Hemicordylus capensis]
MLQRLRTLLHNRRPKSGPPEGSSKKKEEGATVPMAAYPNCWHFLACCRKPRHHQEPEQQGSSGISTPPAPPRPKWHHLCRRREAVAVKAGGDAHKHRQSSRGLGNQSGDSLVSSLHCSPFSSTSYQSQLEDCKVDEDLIEIIHRHMEDREERANNQDEDVHFLAVLCACCKAAYKSGQESLDLPYTKGELLKEIVVVMEKSPVQSGPTILLLYAMAAVSCLSKIKPPTDPELESAILRFAVRGVIKVQAGNVHKQALHKLAADNLELMLRGFLSEAPTTQHLLSLLEHINIWILSRNAQERARASKLCASLLRFSVMMPDCDNSAELPSLGHHVAKLGICIMDSRRDVSRYAREGIYRLLEVLLNHKGQSSRDAWELWSRRRQEDGRILAYLNAARVGEAFREIFNKDQRRSFLRTTLWAIDHPLYRVQEAGLILLYSLLGMADALMGYEEEEIRRKIWLRLC